MTSTEEVAIINEIFPGNTDVFEKIMSKYGGNLYGYIFKLVRNEHVAEELLQETFIKVYRNLDKFDKSKKLSIWIIAVARNIVFDYFRKSKQDSKWLLIDEKDIGVNQNILNEPEYFIERKETMEMIDEIINNLPKKYKELIVLKYFEGLHYDEISLRLKISSNKVKWRLHQARRKIAKEYSRFKKSGEGEFWTVK